MEHSTVHTLLDDLAGAPAPKSTVDISQAILAGRRTIRRRRMLASGSVAAAVVATLFVVMGLTRTAPIPPSTPSPTAAPESFDPLRVYAELRRLPFTPDRLDTTTGRNSLTVVASQDTQPSGDVRLTVVTAGHEVANPLREPVAVRPGQAAHGQAAEPLNGHRAEWTWSGTTTAALRWEYAPGAWAEVSVSGLPGDPRTVAREIASLVRFGANTGVRLPFQLDGVRAPLEPRLVRTSFAGEDWRAAVYFGPPDTAPGEVLPLSITASRSTGVDDTSATTTVDGHSAALRSTPDGQSWLDVYDVDGVDVTIAATDPDTAAALPGGFTAVYRTLKVRGDPATW
jgi:hypothetical protein